MDLTSSTAPPPSPPPPPPPLSVDKGSDLLSSLGALLFSDRLSDVVLLVGAGEEAIPAHRLLLAAQSEVFSAMLYHSPMLEASRGEVRLPGVEPALFRRLLAFMYTGRVEAGGPREAVALMALADYFGVVELKERLGEYARRSVGDGNVWDMLRLAADHKVPPLYRQCLVYVCERFERLAESPEMALLDEATMKDVAASDGVNAPERAVFAAALRWGTPENARRRARESRERLRRMGRRRRAAVATGGGVGDGDSNVDGEEEEEEEEENIAKEELERAALEALRRVVAHVRLPLMSPGELADLVEPAGVVPYEELYRAIAHRHGSRRMYGPGSDQLRHRVYGVMETARWDEERLLRALLSKGVPLLQRCFLFSNSTRTVRRCFGMRAPPVVIRSVRPLASGRMQWSVSIDRCSHRFGQRLEVGLVTASFSASALSGSVTMASEPESSGDDEDEDEEEKEERKPASRLLKVGGSSRPVSSRIPLSPQAAGREGQHPFMDAPALAAEPDAAAPPPAPVLVDGPGSPPPDAPPQKRVSPPSRSSSGGARAGSSRRRHSGGGDSSPRGSARTGPVAAGAAGPRRTASCLPPVCERIVLAPCDQEKADSGAAAGDDIDDDGVPAGAPRSWYVNSLQFSSGDTIRITADLYERTVTFENVPGRTSRRRHTSLVGVTGGTDGAQDMAVLAAASDATWRGTARLPREPVFLAAALLSNGNNSGENQVRVTLLPGEDDDNEE